MTDDLTGLVIFLEWLDATEVKCWRNTTETHEDVAKRWLRSDEWANVKTLSRSAASGEPDE